MKWQIIDKSNSTQPTTGSYSQWKPQLAREARSQCVYCCIHENRFGGIRNFHVEHYRPKSLFPGLENDYRNLFYACGVCNVFKSDDWPAEHEIGRYDIAAYPDPSQVDYNDFLSIDEGSGTASSHTLTGKYLIERLHLNRPQMIGLRAISALSARLQAAQEEIRALLDAGAIDSQNKDEVIRLLTDLLTLFGRFIEVRPYGPDQLR